MSNNDDVIKTGSIGSCIVVTLYDHKTKIGGLAHAMLPDRGRRTKNEEREKDSAKYVADAIDLLIIGINKAGGNTTGLEAKLVGGASMFKRLAHEKNSIGHKNIVAARDYLEKNGITVHSEDTGGSSGKVVDFNLTNGVLEVNTKL